MAGDKALITDSADGNKTKQATVGSLPISTATQTALDGKANASAFANQAAFTSAWGWTPGGISAWSDIQALISGTGDYIKYDGTRGTPAGSTYTAGTGIDITGGVISSTVTGTLPPATEGQVPQKGASAWGAVDLAPLAFTDNVSRNSSTGVVSVPVTATAASGSAVPFTSGGAYTALGGKQDTLVSGTNIKTINSTSILGSGNIDITGGTGGYVTLSAVPYSDVACTTGQYGYYGSTAYLCTGGFWTSKWTLTTHSNPTPTTYSLTITPSGFTGADKFTYNSTDYTTEQTITGLSADASFTVTPDTGRSIACTGTGLTDNTGGSYTANTDTANVAATCTSSAVATSETLTPSSVSPAWTKVGSGTNLTTLTDSDDATYFYTASTSATTSMAMGAVVGSGTIAGVKMCGRVKFDTSATYGPRFRLNNGSTYQSFSPDPITGLTTSWQDICSSEMTTNPYTSSAWTASALNALTWYIASNASSNSGAQTQVSKIWGVVRFQ